MFKYYPALICFCVSFSSSSYASLTIDQTPGKPVILTAEPCSLADAQLKAFRAWKARVGEEVPLTFEKEGNDEKCSYDISKGIPDEIRSVIGVSPVTKGPNCYNAALVAAKIPPAPRFFHKDGEIEFWLKSPLCQKLTSPNQLRAGDVITLYSIVSEDSDGEIEDPQPNIEHAFVYLSPEFSFSKNGENKNKPYLIRKTDAVFSAYEFPSLASSSNHIVDQPKDGVTKYSQGFRCQTWEEFEKTTQLEKTAISPEESLFRERVIALAGAFSKRVMEGPKGASTIPLQEELVKLSKESRKFVVEKDQYKTFDALLRRAWYLRLHSLYNQRNHTISESGERFLFELP